jgi:propionyl-CoA carboxylase alpha chain
VLRHHLTTAAVRAAQSVGYVGAGTVEFIVDPEDGAFYFIEMNTRLQVEHPVTEERYDTDLVEAQLLIAAGEPLPPGHPGPPEGHAIELRLYAENPAKKFLPSPGTLQTFEFPPWPSIRLDMGYRQGGVVTPWYDPLLGKITAHAESREVVIERLAEALGYSKIEGIHTNAPLLGRILEHPDFIAGRTPTSWLESTLPELLPS